MPFHKCSSARCKVFFILLIFAANSFILASVKNNLDLLTGVGAVVLENVRKSVFFPARCSFSGSTVARIVLKKCSHSHPCVGRRIEMEDGSHFTCEAGVPSSIHPLSVRVSLSSHTAMSWLSL